MSAKTPVCISRISVLRQKDRFYESPVLPVILCALNFREWQAFSVVCIPALSRLLQDAQEQRRRSFVVTRPNDLGNALQRCFDPLRTQKH